MGGKDSQEFMAITPDRTNLNRWVVLDKSVVSFEEIPEDVLEGLKQNSWLGLYLVKIPRLLKESGYAANLEMATSEYKPRTAVVAEETLVKLLHQMQKTIEVAAPLNVWKKANH